MHTFRALEGVYAAALTPLNPDLSPALEEIPSLLAMLAQQGCHGALLLGTTGEGPSFSCNERSAILRAGLRVRQQYPHFRLLAGTGTPSLDETASLTRAAFDLGYDGVVTLPPYYFRKVTDEGLFQWFSHILQHAVPDGGAFLSYHIPPLTGVGLSLELIARLRERFPDRFAGIKDSSGSPEFARQLGERFGEDLLVLNGNDGLFSLALENKAGGCITAMANIYAQLLRQVWDAFQAGAPDLLAQARLGRLRTVLESLPPFPPLLKGLYPHLFPFSHWPVRPPLLPVPEADLRRVLAELAAAQAES
jgi:4-hydroxy-tetrahydrodipicolinate synthase